MKIFVIGSAPPVWGFALAGVPGRVVEDEAGLHAALDAALADEALGIILVSEDVAVMAQERIETLMIQGEVPLFVVIPGPAGPSPDYPSIGEVLDGFGREAAGTIGAEL